MAADGIRRFPRPASHHRDVQGGAARAAVFGVSDGLVSNLGLLLGVAAADPAPGVVRLAGLAGLIAGAISMGAGEYNSMKVQAELFERELDMERTELRRNPEFELAELSELYESRGMSPEEARGRGPLPDARPGPGPPDPRPGGARHRPDGARLARPPPPCRRSWPSRSGP